jgi:prepilin peptidase CpaA
MNSVDAILFVLVLLTGTAAIIDYRSGHIPNWLVVAGSLVGPLLSAGVGALAAPADARLSAALIALGSSILGLVLCALVPLVLFRVGATGGGDVKLLAAIGAIAGPALGLQIELCAFILTALYAPLRLAYEGQLLRLLGNTAALAINPFLPRERRRPVPEALLTSVPFGPAIFCATLLLAVATRGLP